MHSWIVCLSTVACLVPVRDASAKNEAFFAAPLAIAASQHPPLPRAILEAGRLDPICAASEIRCANGPPSLDANGCADLGERALAPRPGDAGQISAREQTILQVSLFSACACSATHTGTQMRSSNRIVRASYREIGRAHV